MDLKQTDHLKAYGIAYFALKHGVDVDWLLNYRGGSFMMDYHDEIANECRVRGVAFDVISSSDALKIYAQIQDENNNMDVVRLEKAPKIAVYVPPNFRPWDDAVTLALEYAEIPYDKIWDEEILNGKVYEYDWLHLHHEDFTGQYGKFYASFGRTQWYIEEQMMYEREAKRLGFKKVSELKKAVARGIKEYIASGGFVFAMCSATDAFDIALAAENTDICDVMYDGDPPDPNCQEKLDFSKTLAFGPDSTQRWDLGWTNYDPQNTDYSKFVKVYDRISETPAKFELRQNYPNPFNPETVIEFDLPKSSNVKLIVYNSLGQVVEKLVDEYLSSGSYRVKFNGGHLPSGVYFYKLTAGGYSSVKKMLLIK